MRKIKELPADHLTMISAYLRLKGERKALLESIPRDKNKGRYSIIGIDPIHEITCYGNELAIDGEAHFSEDPLKEIDQFVVRKDPSEAGLPFEAGAIGYVGYDVFALYEDIGTIPYCEMNIPDIHFYIYESFLLFDHTQEKMTLVQDNVYSNRCEAELDSAMERMVQNLLIPSPEETKTIKLGKLNFTSNYSKEQFMEMVNKAKTYIQAGDMFQMVPSQRLSAAFPYDPFDYYRKLRLSNPSAYLYYFDFGETKIIGSSPESLVSVKKGTVATNPIAGTRARGNTPEEDQQFEEELIHDEKELAEHRMLVDLGRNDIGKIAKVGTVTVPIYMTIEKYRFVMHIVSVVEGKLKSGFSAMDALKATLPAGTVSGAPKIRAMKRIYEMETAKRGVYAGAAGYLTKNDQADFAIAIRTMVLHKGTAYVQAGAGIVYDSEPEKEYAETLQKARALLEVTKHDFISR